MLNFAFSPEIKHKQRPFERCFFPLVYLVLQNNHALRQNTMDIYNISFHRIKDSHLFTKSHITHQRASLISFKP